MSNFGFLETFLGQVTALCLKNITKMYDVCDGRIYFHQTFTDFVLNHQNSDEWTC